MKDADTYDATRSLCKRLNWLLVTNIVFLLIFAFSMGKFYSETRLRVGNLEQLQVRSIEQRDRDVEWRGGVDRNLELIRFRLDNPAAPVPPGPTEVPEQEGM